MSLPFLLKLCYMYIQQSYSVNILDNNNIYCRAQKIVEEEKEEDEEQEEREEVQPTQSKSSRLQVSSDEEDGCTFQEKTHPQTSNNSGSDPLVKSEEGGRMMTGSFKGFSFKKKSSSSSRNIKQRTSQW